MRRDGYRVEEGRIQSREGKDTELRRDGYRVEEEGCRVQEGRIQS